MQRRPPSTTPEGVETAALRLCRGDCAICGWRFGTLGCFALCAARVFRPLRRAGVSLAAASDQRRCLWTPRFFEKNRVKLLYGWGFIWIWCGAAESVRQRPQSMLRIVAVRGPSAPQPRRNRVPYALVGRDLCVPPLVCTKNHRMARNVPTRRAGACSRRRYGPSIMMDVGAGIPDGPGRAAEWFRFPSPFHPPRPKIFTFFTQPRKTMVY